MKKILKLILSIFLLIILARLVVWSVFVILPIIVATSILVLVYIYIKKGRNNGNL